MFKKKSFIGFMIACCLMLSSLFVLTACGETEHQHKFSTAWSSDATYHWHEAECEDTDEVKDKGFHKNSGWEKDDTQHWKDCDVCGRELIKKTNHNFIDFVCECGEVSSDAVVGYTSPNGTTVYSITLMKSDIESLEDGSTITLLKDITYSGEDYFSLNNSITIDFNGHTLTTEKSGGFDVGENLKEDKKVDVVLKNGVLDTFKWGAWVENGASLTVEDDFTILANRAKATNYAGIAVVGTGSTLNLNGTVKVEGDTNAVSGNGSVGFGGVIMNVNDGAVVECLEGNGVYMPHTSELNIGAAQITGKTAVYLRAGVTTINGATLVATGDKTDYSFVSGSQQPTGDAIVVNSVDYPGGAPTLNLVAATITSAHGDEIAVYKVSSVDATINNSTSYVAAEYKINA